MLRLAFRTLRLRKGGFIGTFIAVFFGALIVASCGGLMETGIRSNAEPQRLAAAPILVTGGQTFALPKEDPASSKPTTSASSKTRGSPNASGSTTGWSPGCGPFPASRTSSVK